MQFRGRFRDSEPASVHIRARSVAVPTDERTAMTTMTENRPAAGEKRAVLRCPGWWISDHYSFLTGESAVYNIDALEDSELLLLSSQAEEQLLQKFPKFERYFRILLQNSVIATQRRLIGSLSQTAEERYTDLIANCPTIPQRVPQHMMASFLGITPETLSRIRKQMTTKS